MEPLKENCSSYISPNSQLFADGDGIHLKVLRWYRQQDGMVKYLVKYTRPELPQLSTHALIEKIYIPMLL